MNPRKAVLTAAAATMTLAVGLATATPAQAAWYPNGHPTVRVGQRCPSSYQTGVVNIRAWHLTTDTRTRCAYWTFEPDAYQYRLTTTWAKK